MLISLGFIRGFFAFHVPGLLVTLEGSSGALFAVRWGAASDLSGSHAGGHLGVSVVVTLGICLNT